MPVDNEKLGKRLKYYRETEGKTLETLAEEIHVTKDYVKKIELGLRAPVLDILVDVANNLNVSADELLADSLNKSSPEANPEMLELLIDCRSQERDFIIRLVKEVKKIFIEMKT